MVEPVTPTSDGHRVSRSTTEKEIDTSKHVTPPLLQIHRLPSFQGVFFFYIISLCPVLLNDSFFCLLMSKARIVWQSLWVYTPRIKKFPAFSGKLQQRHAALRHADLLLLYQALLQKPLFCPVPYMDAAPQTSIPL